MTRTGPSSRSAARSTSRPPPSWATTPSAALQDVSPHVVLDLTGVTFMDSTGLKVLLSIQRRADLAGGSFALAGVGRTGRRSSR